MDKLRREFGPHQAIINLIIDCLNYSAERRPCSRVLQERVSDMKREMEENISVDGMRDLSVRHVQMGFELNKTEKKMKEVEVSFTMKFRDNQNVCWSSFYTFMLITKLLI